MLALEFDHCAEVDGYQPAPDCLVGVDDTAHTEVNVVRIAEYDTLVVGCNVSVISIEGEPFKRFRRIKMRARQAGIIPIVPKTLTSNSLAEGRFDKQDFIYIAAHDEYRCPAGQRAINRFTTVEAGLSLDVYWSSACPHCPMKARCTPSQYRRIRRWQHEAVLEAMQERLDRQPEMMRIRRQTVEHPFGTIKHWMGWTHFLTKTLARVRTEMSLHVLAYNMKRVMRILGIEELMQAMIFKSA